MAIVKMNKFTLLTFGSHKEEFLKKLQQFSKVEFVNLQDEALIEKNIELKELSKDTINAKVSDIEENLSKAKNTIEFLEKYMPKKKGIKALEEDKDTLSVEELNKKIEASNWKEIYEKVLDKENELSNLENKIVKLEGEIEILAPWQKLDTSFESLKGLKKASALIGSIAKQYEERIFQEIPKAYVEVISRNNNGVNILVLVNKEDEEETLNLIRSFGFTPFRTEYRERPESLITDYKVTIENIKSKIFFIKEEVAGFEEEYNLLKLVYDYYFNKIEIEKASNNFLKTKNTVAIQGWCSLEDNEELKAICNSEMKNAYYLEFNEVQEEEIDTVPIKLNNGRLSKTFESVTEMYSYPKYNEVDPTPLLVPFYLIFFGMMVADAGYGLVMLIVAAGALKFINLSQSNKDFARFFLYLSIPTILFGMIYGSFFGDALTIPGLIDPERDVNTILVISIVLGVIQIFFGLGIKAYVLIMSDRKLDAFYDVGSWLITLTSVGLLIGAGMLGLPTYFEYIAIGGFVVGSLLIVLTGGRAEKTKGARIGQGLYALYGITSYVGDLVSYTRLMALGLAGGSIAGALNLLIGELPGVAAIIFGPVIFVLAHVFNLLLSLLGAYVHTARLQYVEYFSKFYDGGGRPFKPFKASEKYMNIKKN